MLNNVRHLKEKIKSKTHESSIICKLSRHKNKQKQTTNPLDEQELKSTFSSEEHSKQIYNDDYFDVRSECSCKSFVSSKLSPPQPFIPVAVTFPNLKHQESKNQTELPKPVRRRRTEIKPKLDTSNFKVLLNVLVNSIGKDLTRIPVPATFFSEPLSFLQRSCESLEYSYLLDMAAECNDSLEQMTYVAAFSISEYSTFFDRIAKPFNPLLNETFEYDRADDLGWCCLAEQVSHHPPRLAMVIFYNCYTDHKHLPKKILWSRSSFLARNFQERCKSFQKMLIYI